MCRGHALLWSIHTRPSIYLRTAEILTEAGTPLVFGKEQKEAFVELEKRLSNSETFGYFDKDAQTQVIADKTRGGGYSQKNWVGVCGPLPKTLTLSMTKICEIPYPIYDLTLESKSSSDQTVNINVKGFC